MGLLGRFRKLRDSTPTSARAVQAVLHYGDEALEVVGESYRQDALWAICGGTPGDVVRHEVVAVLVPEPQNPYDPNAIAIHIEGHLVGYLPRDVAAQYGPGLRVLVARCSSHVALQGVIVGGGHRENGLGMLGVWLDHDPQDFGLEPTGRSRRVGPAGRSVAPDGSMRTGFTEAWLTDVEDETYDLSWFDDLPDADVPAIAMLRELLAADPDLIDRHFQFAELETRLYRCRDLYDTALDEFDAVCQAHDAEMEAICEAFRAKWSRVPLLGTYRQMAIRRQKQKDWQSCRWWAERGLALYGSSAARQDAVEDLLKRRNRALTRLEKPIKQAAKDRFNTSIVAAVGRSSDGHPPSNAVRQADIEVLVCSRCEGSFERMRVRGRKPLLCPDCRSSPDGGIEGRRE